MTYAQRLAVSRVPDHLHEGLALYLDDHRPTGGFLHAVLTNNLMDAMCRGDRDSREHLYDIVSFLVNEAPLGAWGSPGLVDKWLAQRGGDRVMRGHHTPGPWRWNKPSKNGAARCQMLDAPETWRTVIYHDANWLPTKADTRLIAAAPDLLAALNNLWVWATESRTHLDTDPVPDGLGATVLAAIIKAEGQS